MFLYVFTVYICPFIGVSDPDSQAYGQEELFGEELGSRRNTGINVHNLLW